MNGYANTTTSATPIASTIERIFACGRITSADRRSLQQAMISENDLSREEQHQVKRLWDWLQMGFLTVVD